MSLTTLFVGTIFPLTLTIGAGYILGKWRNVPEKPLSVAGVEVFGPALLFSHIPTNLGQYSYLLWLTMAVVGGSITIAYGLAHLLKLRDRDLKTNFVFALAFSNFGFLGLPLVEFFYGEAALSTAFIVLLFLNIPTGILAVYMSSPKPEPIAALKHTLTTPFSLSVLLVLILGFLGLQLPDWLHRPMKFLGSATVPVMLLVLGIHLSSIRLKSLQAKPLAIAVLLRYFLPLPLIFLITKLLGLEFTNQSIQVAALQLSTPTGMMPLLFMTAFDRKTDFLATAIFISTVGFALSLPILAIFLG